MSVPEATADAHVYMKPPHANPAHPSHGHYRPETDDYPLHEAILERQWRQQKGVDPSTGKAWLTPRMERNAIRTAEIMANTVVSDGSQPFAPRPGSEGTQK